MAATDSVDASQKLKPVIDHWVFLPFTPVRTATGVLPALREAADATCARTHDSGVRARLLRIACTDCERPSKSGVWAPAQASGAVLEEV